MILKFFWCMGFVILSIGKTVGSQFTRCINCRLWKKLWGVLEWLDMDFV